MQTVTSDAVAEALDEKQNKEWKILDGYDISGITYDEIAISVWFDNSSEQILYSKVFAKGMFGGKQNVFIGGYMYNYQDYGLCNVNFINNVFSLRNVIYGGVNYTSQAGLRIRYR